MKGNKYLFFVIRIWLDADRVYSIYSFKIEFSDYFCAIFSLLFSDKR